MKKSFLKRVAAAAVAVPVALTQTALFTSFAAGETAASDSITVETFLQITPDGKRLVKAGEAYGAKEANAANAYVQESVWNEKVKTVLNAHAGKEFTLNTQKLADAVKKDNAYVDVLKDAITDENSTAVAKIDRDKIVITVNFDYNYAQNVADVMADRIKDKIEDVDFVTTELSKLNNLKGTVVMTADTTKLLEGKTVDFDAVVTLDGEKKEGVKAVETYVANLTDNLLTALEKDAQATADKAIDEKQALKDEKQAEKNAKQEEKDAKQADVEAKEAELAAKQNENAPAEEIKKAEADLADAQAKLADAQAKLDDAQAKLDDAQKQLDDARDMANGEIKDRVNNYESKFNRYKDRADRVSREFKDQTFTADNADDLLNQIEEKLEVRYSQADRIPDSVEATKQSDIRGRNVYNALDNLFTRAIEQVNKKLGDETVSMNLDQVVDEVEKAYDLTVSGSASAVDFTANGEGLFYVPDTDSAEAIEVYTAYINENVLAAENKQIVEGSQKTVKVVEAAGNGTAKSEFEATGTLNIYRVFTYEVEDKTTEPTSEEATTETSETTEAPTTTEPTTTEPTTTEPTTTEPTTTEPTTTEPTTTEPTTTEPVEIETNVKIEVAADKGFFFAHDTNAFEVDSLIASASVVSGKASIDYSKFEFGLTAAKADKNLSPADVYNNNTDEDGATMAYAWKPLYIFYDGKPVYTADGEAVTAYVYIGVKGDANLDGQCNAVDANEVLIYSAAKGAGSDYYLSSGSETFTEGTERLEQFAFFLGDTDTESTVGESDAAVLNSIDANNILIYSALKGAGGGEWIPDVLDAPYPTYSEEIAIKAGLIK